MNMAAKKLDFIDWQMCIVKLRRHMTYVRIAGIVSSDEKHIRRLACGDTKEPRFNTGIRILDLAYDVLSDDDFKRIRDT
jgi:hypothetical protein